MEKSKSIWQALSDFQAECPAINKGAKGYGYKYADLPSIHQVIDPLLRKHGLVLMQPLLNRSIMTKLVHISSGEYEVSSIEIPDGVMLKGMNQFQSDGSAITYYRRYALSSILGIVTDEDTDAAGKQVTKPVKPKMREVKPNTALFNNCVKAYTDGVSREEMTEKNLQISDEAWNAIETASSFEGAKL